MHTTGTNLGGSRASEIDERLKAIPGANKLELHPSAHLRFRQMVEELEYALRPPRYQARPPGEEAYAYRDDTWRPLTEGEERQEITQRSRELEQAMRDAHSAFRSLIEMVEVFPEGPPTDKRGGGPVRLQVHGQLAALLKTYDGGRRGGMVAGLATPEN